MLPTPAGSPPAGTYAPTHAGARNSYQVTTEGGGTSAQSERVAAVHAVSGGFTVLVDVSGGPVARIVYFLHPDGSYDAPVGAGLPVPGVTLAGSSTMPTPAQLASGASYSSDAGVRVTQAGHVRSVDAHVTHQGVGMETVSVPAGSFRAQVVAETTVVPGTDPVTVIARLWLVKGIGVVQQIVTADVGTRSIRETWALASHSS